MNAPIVQYGISDEAIVIVDARHVNLEDVRSTSPGRIIWCNGNPHECVRVISEEVHYEHLAGQDSEAA